MVTDASNTTAADDVRVLVKARALLPILPVVNPTPDPIGSSTPTPIATQAVVPNSTPTFGSAVVEDMIFTMGQQVETSPLPSGRGGDGDIGYRLSPVVPNGLHFDTSSRAIIGIPTEALERTRFTYTATDSDGDSASLRFHITVVEPVATIETDSQTLEPTPTPIPPPKTTWLLALTPTASPAPQPMPTPPPQPTATTSPGPTVSLTATWNLANPATASPTATLEAAPSDKGGASVRGCVIIVLVVAASVLTGTTAVVIRRRR